MRRVFKEKPSELDDAIDRVKHEMHVFNPVSEEYADLMGILERLYRLKFDESKNRVSPDTIAIVCGNLLGILIIVAYEQKHVMVSRGMNFLLRPKQ